MKKLLMCAVAATAFSTSAMAGGLLTNTNQNAAFLRQMSQDAIIDITGLYANPAGTAFLNNGWHLSLNIQSAFQSRDIETKFTPFGLNINNPSSTHNFHGHASAPVIPSFQLSYNKDKWSVNASFAIGGGGGKCTFDEGLGSFEALTYQNLMKGIAKTAPASYIAGLVPAIIGQNPGMSQEEAVELAASNYASEQLTGYSMESNMKGRNYVFGLTLGGTYKFLDNLAGYVGVRMQYATNNYSGGIYKTAMRLKPYGDVLIPATYTAGVDESGNPVQKPAEVELDCDQTGFSAAPIIGIDYKLNEHWNFAARYEAPTIMKLKNSTTMNEYTTSLANDNETLGKFKDGEKVREDIPGILTLGVQYSPIESVRLNAGFHEYFDKDAKKYADKQKLIDTNTWELNFGAEYDLCKWVTLSASWQTTQYGLSDAYMDDLSFNLSNHMIGAGVRVNAMKNLTVDLGYMHTFYGDRIVKTKTAAGPKVDSYHRTNDVFGIGVNLHF